MDGAALDPYDPEAGTRDFVIERPAERDFVILRPAHAILSS
jgi:hypothetical protein